MPIGNSSHTYELRRLQIVDIVGLSEGLDAKQPLIAAGTTNQFLSWDKTMQEVDWTYIANKPSLFPPSAHGHLAADLPSNVVYTDANGIINDWTVLGVSYVNTSPYPKLWYKVYSLTGAGRGDEDIEVLYNGDPNYFSGQCILRLKITRYEGESTNQLHVTVSPVSGWPSNGLVKVDGGEVWVASNRIWGSIKATLVQSHLNPGRSLFNTTPVSVEPNGIRIDGTFGIRTLDGDNQTIVAHPLMCGSAYVDGNHTINGNQTIEQSVNTAYTSPGNVSIPAGASVLIKNTANVNGGYAGISLGVANATSGDYQRYAYVGAVSKADEDYSADIVMGQRIAPSQYKESVRINQHSSILTRRNLGSAVNITITSETTQTIDLSSSAYAGKSRFILQPGSIVDCDVYFTGAVTGDEIFLEVGGTSDYQIAVAWRIDPSDGTWMRYAGRRWLHLICTGTAPYSTGNTWDIFGEHGLLNP